MLKDVIYIALLSGCQQKYIKRFNFCIRYFLFDGIAALTAQVTYIHFAPNKETLCFPGIIII